MHREGKTKLRSNNTSFWLLVVTKAGFTNIVHRWILFIFANFFSNNYGYGYGALNATFNKISVTLRKPPTCPWVGFKFTTLVVIGTDCISQVVLNPTTIQSRRPLLTMNISNTILEMKIWIYCSKWNPWIYFYIHFVVVKKTLLVWTKFYWSWAEGMVLKYYQYQGQNPFFRILNYLHTATYLIFMKQKLICQLHNISSIKESQ